MSLGLSRKLVGGPAHCALEFDDSRDTETPAQILAAPELMTSVFLRAMQHHELDGWLSKPGTTILAPTDAAFRQLRHDFRYRYATVEEMMDAPGIADILKYHVIEEEVQRAQMVDANDVNYEVMDTVAHNTLFRGCDEGVYFLGGAGNKKRCHCTLNVKAADGCNVYVLDRVLLPNHSPL